MTLMKRASFEVSNNGSKRVTVTVMQDHTSAMQVHTSGVMTTIDAYILVDKDAMREVSKFISNAQEILGTGGADCVYQANQQLEVVASRLRELIKEIT